MANKNELTNKPLCTAWWCRYVCGHGSWFWLLCWYRRYATGFSFNGNILPTPPLYGTCVTFWVLSPVACWGCPACSGLCLIKALPTLTLPAILCAMIGKHQLVHMTAWGPESCPIAWIIKMSMSKRQRLPASLVLYCLYVVMRTTRARSPATTATVSCIERSSVPLILWQFFCTRRRQHSCSSIQASVLWQWCKRAGGTLKRKKNPVLKVELTCKTQRIWQSTKKRAYWRFWCNLHSIYFKD